MLKYILKQNIKGNILSFGILVMVFTVIFTIISQLSFVKTKLMSDQQSYVDRRGESYIDIFFDQDDSELYQIPDSDQFLKSMNEKLSKSEEFKYYEINTQFLYILNYRGPEIFRQMYESGNPYEKGIILEYNGVKYPPAEPIKSIQLSNNFFSDFDLKLNQGKQFEETDYNYYMNKTVPIILGYEYKGQYKIGQIFQSVYIGEPFELKVVGFLEKDSKIQMGDYVKYLDRYIVMPFLNCSETINTQDKIFQIRHYGLKTSGIAKANDGVSTTKVINSIHKMAKESGLKKYTVNPMDLNSGANQEQISEDFIMNFKNMYFVVLLFSSIAICIIFNKKVIKNMNNYWAYFVSGASILTIKRSIQYEIILILGLSNLLSIGIQSLGYKIHLTDVVTNLVTSLIIWIVTSYFIGNTFMNRFFLENSMEV